MSEHQHHGCLECQAFQEKLIRLVQTEFALARAATPKYLKEARLYLPSATTLAFAFHTQAQSLLRITKIIVVVSSPGTLTISERVWPVNGLTVLDLAPDGLLIPAETSVNLVQNTAGLLSLEFFGQEMADRGQRW